MPPIDAASLSVPLWSAAAVAGTVTSTVVGGVLWALRTFERKEDVRRRLDAQEALTRKIAGDVAKITEDVAYIRGNLDVKPPR